MFKTEMTIDEQKNRMQERGTLTQFTRNVQAATFFARLVKFILCGALFAKFVYVVRVKSKT